MTWYEKLLDTARDVAPTVAGGAAMALSGGNPALGVLASSVIGRVVGRQGADLEHASEAILGDPEKLAEFRSRMRDAELKELEIRAKDTASARDLLKHSKGPIVISTLISFAFSALVFMVMFVEPPEGSQAVAYMLLGTLAGAFTQVLNFWLGTSVGSKEKDNTISRFASAAEIDQKARRSNGNQ